jgi:hypothetical protein
MPEFKPLPMKDTVNPEPMHPASQKMSEWMNSYMPTVMNKINAAGPGPTNMGMSNQSGGGVADMLFKAIHPDTFNRVLDFLKPTPRQEGGDVEPGREYTVGEAGPEKFKPAVPGQIIPYGKEPKPLGPTAGGITYGGMTDTPMGLSMPAGPNRGYRMADMEPPGAPGTPEYMKRFAGREAEWMGKEQQEWAKRTGRPMETPIGGTVPSMDPRDVSPLGGHTQTVPSMDPRDVSPLGSHTQGEYPISGWKDYGEGIKYRMGEGAGGVTGPAPLPSPEEQEIAARKRWDQPGYAEAHPMMTPGYRKGYYEAHPEEKAAQEFYDMARGPSPSSFEGARERMQEMNLMDIAKSTNVTPEARKAAADQLTAMRSGKTEREALAVRGAGEAYGKALEYGPTSPGTQEKLARAQFEKAEAIAKMAGIPLDQYLKTAEAEKHLGEARKSDFIPLRGGGVYHVSSGQFYEPPEQKGKTIASTIQKLEAEVAKETGGDPLLTKQRLREAVRRLVDLGPKLGLDKKDIPPEFWKMSQLEFADALKKAGKTPKNQEELNLAYSNYMKIPIEG